MRFTIERLRTLVLAAGVLLVIALAMFLAVGKWKRHFNVRELLKPLGANIQQEGGVRLRHIVFCADRPFSLGCWLRAAAGSQQQKSRA